MFCSEKLNYYKIVAPRESGREIMLQMGDKGRLHLVDLNKLELNTKKYYHPQLRVLEEIITNLKQISETVSNHRQGDELLALSDTQMTWHLKRMDTIPKLSGLNEKTYLEHVEDKIIKTAKGLKQQVTSKEGLESEIQRKEEELMVLRILNLKLPNEFK